MKKILLILFLLASFLRADAWEGLDPNSANYDGSLFVTDFPIYVQGDTGYIAYLLNAAAMLAQDSNFLYLVQFAIALTIIVSALKYFQVLQISFTIKTAATIIASLTMMFAPTTVHIEDTRTNLDANLCSTTYTHQTVANVPYIISLPASVTSTVGQMFSEMIDTATTVITNAEGQTVEIGQISPSAIGYGVLEETYREVLNNARLYTSEPEVARFNSLFTSYVKSCMWDTYVRTKGESGHIVHSPDGGYLKAWSPDTLGIRDVPVSVKELPNTTCGDLWDDEIDAHYDSVATKVLEAANKAAPKCMNIQNMADGLKDIGLITISDGNETSLSDITAITALKSFVVNHAAKQSIIDGVNAAGGSGVDMANKLTAKYSEAKMQAEGAGGFKFFAEMLPKSMHFFYGIVLFLGIFVGISALAQWYGASIAIFKAYFLSFFAYEAAKISLVIVSNALYYYESVKAADRLAATNFNGASFDGIMSTTSHIATMTAVGGTIGTMIIFAIPAIIMKGDFFNFLGSLSAPGQKYAGNDLETSSANVAQRQAGDAALAALGRNEDAARKLSAMGLHAPSGVGALEYYNKIQQQMGALSQGAISGANMNTIGNQAMGGMVQGQKQLSTMAAVGSTGSITHAATSGTMAGNAMTGSTAGDHMAANSSGFNMSDYREGFMQDSAKKASTMASYGRNATVGDAIGAGAKAGAEMGGADKGSRSLLEQNGEGVLKSVAKTNTIDAGNKSITAAQALQSKFGEDLTGTYSDNAGNTISHKGMNRSLADMNLAKSAGMASAFDTFTEGGGSIGESTRVNSLAGMKGEMAKATALKGTWGNTLDKNVNTGESYSGAQLERMKQLGDDVSKIDGEIEQLAARKSMFDSKANQAPNEASRGVYSRQSSEMQAQIDRKLWDRQNALDEQTNISSDPATKSQSMSYESSISNIETANQQGMVGKAAGIAKNLQENSNMYMQNSQYGELSQQQSTQKKLSIQGGIQGAVDTDVNEAGIKAASQKQTVEKQLMEAAKSTGDKDLISGVKQGVKEAMEEAMQKIGDVQGSLAGVKTATDIQTVNANQTAGIIGNDGTTTQAGREALAIKPGEDASAMMKKRDMGTQATEVLSGIINKLAKEGRANEIPDAIAPFIDSSGQLKNGQEFWNTMAEQKQGVFSGHNSIMLGNGIMASGGFSDGKFTGKLSSGIATNHDDSATNKHGQEDMGVIKNSVKEALANRFGDETATELIQGWNAYGEMLAGGAVLGAGYAGLKKITNRNSQSGDKTLNAAKKPTSNPNNAPIHSNIDSSMSSSSKLSDIDNYSRNIESLQEELSGTGKDLEKAKLDLKESTLRLDDNKLDLDKKMEALNSLKYEKNQLLKGGTVSDKVMDGIDDKIAEAQREVNKAQVRFDKSQFEHGNHSSKVQGLDTKMQDLTNQITDTHINLTNAKINATKPPAPGFFDRIQDAVSHAHGWKGKSIAAVTAVFGVSAASGDDLVTTAGNLLNVVDPSSYLTGTEMGDGTIEGAVKNGTFTTNGNFTSAGISVPGLNQPLPSGWSQQQNGFNTTSAIQADNLLAQAQQTQVAQQTDYMAGEVDNQRQQLKAINESFDSKLKALGSNNGQLSIKEIRKVVAQSKE